MVVNKQVSRTKAGKKLFQTKGGGLCLKKVEIMGCDDKLNLMMIFWQVNFFIGAFYDGVILLGMALNETLTANESLHDGQQITQRMWNRTFEGVTGNVTIDENGDRDADYSILDMNPDTGKFEV